MKAGGGDWLREGEGRKNKTGKPIMMQNKGRIVQEIPNENVRLSEKNHSVENENGPMGYSWYSLLYICANAYGGHSI